MHDNGHNPYLPMPMHVVRAYYESNDRSLKTLELVFDNQKTVSAFQEFNRASFASYQFW